MALKSLSTKLFVAIAAAALLMWVAGVPGRSILSVAAVGLMIAMHAGGHGHHGSRPGEPAERGHDAAHAGAAPSSPSASEDTPAAADRTHGPGRGGCH